MNFLVWSIRFPNLTLVYINFFIKIVRQNFQTITGMLLRVGNINKITHYCSQVDLVSFSTSFITFIALLLLGSNLFLSATLMGCKIWHLRSQQILSIYVNLLNDCSGQHVTTTSQLISIKTRPLQ